MNSFAVVFHYTIENQSDPKNVTQDFDNAIYLYNTEEEAKSAVRDFYNETISIMEDVEGLTTKSYIFGNNRYARIHQDSSLGAEVTEIFVANVYK